MHKGKIAFLLLLVFNYIILVFVVDYGSETDTEGYKVRIEQLQDENKQLKTNNSQLDQEVAHLTTEKDSLSTAISNKATEREQIKTKRDETMDDINGMDNHKLYGFFSNFKADGVNGQSGH